MAGRGQNSTRRPRRCPLAAAACAACPIPPLLPFLTLPSPSRHPTCPHLPQIDPLSNLQTLHLHSVAYAPAGYARLRGLGALRRLVLEHCQLPACLAQLRGLQVVRLADIAAPPAEEGSDLAAAVAEALLPLLALARLEIPAPPPGSPPGAPPPLLRACRQVAAARPQLCLVPYIPTPPREPRPVAARAPAPQTAHTE